MRCRMQTMFTVIYLHMGIVGTGRPEPELNVENYRINFLYFYNEMFKIQSYHSFLVEIFAKRQQFLASS